jgi:hypothetical protein
MESRGEPECYKLDVIFGISVRKGKIRGQDRGLGI